MKMATDIFGNSNDYEYAYLLTCLKFDDDNDDILNKLNNFIDIEIYGYYKAEDENVDGHSEFGNDYSNEKEIHDEEMT